MKPIKTLLLTLTALLMVSFAFGVECTTTPTENCTLEANTVYTLDFGTYYLNDTGGDGAIIVNGDNVTLDCNGASLVGNGTTNGRGIQSTSHDNITIKNCNLDNYYKDIDIYNIDNFNFSNNNILIFTIGYTSLHLSKNKFFNYSIQNYLFGSGDYGKITFKNVNQTDNYNWTQYCNTSNATYTIKPNEEWNIDCGSGGSSLLLLSNTLTENINPYAGNYIGIGYVDITDYIINYYNLNSSLNFTENRTTSISTEVNFSNNAIMKLNGDWRKDFTVENNTVNITSLPTYNTYCNSTTATCKQNQNNFTETIGANGRVFVFSRTESNEPHPTSLATTISEMELTESAGTYTVTCTGTGIHKHDLTSYGSYYVYHDGVYQGPYTTGEYIATSCSTWQFIRTDAVENIPEADITIENTTDSLSKLVQKFGIIVGIIVAGFIIGALVSGNISIDEFSSKAFILLITAIAIVFLLLLLNGW